MLFAPLFDKTHLSKSCLILLDFMTLIFAPLQTFHTPSLGDEEFEIPPITPPPETESGLGLSDVDSPFPAMQEPPVPHRGPIIPQFPPQSLDLPSITISRNMMEQEGMSVNNSQPVVSTTMHISADQELYVFAPHSSPNPLPLLFQIYSVMTFPHWQM